MVNLRGNEFVSDVSIHLDMFAPVTDELQQEDGELDRRVVLGVEQGDEQQGGGRGQGMGQQTAENVHHMVCNLWLRP